jgi:hypothetical protein
MSPAAVVLVVLTAAAFLLLLGDRPRCNRYGERAHLSHDGAIMLADPMLGGNAACEPATTVTWQAHKRQPLRISHHLTTANRPGPAVVPYQRRR